LEVDFVLLHELMHVALGHCFRHVSSRGPRESERFNVACDIVVNSTLFKEIPQFPGNLTVAGGQPLRLAPDGKEGCEYSAEQVYAMLPPDRKIRAAGGGKGDGRGGGERGQTAGGDGGKGGPKVFRDDHEAWGRRSAQAARRLEDEWRQRLTEAALTLEIQKATRSCGSMPLLAQRVLRGLRRPQLDWRVLLRNFVQQEIYDYSFAPPDRRFQDSPFCLPGWNEKREKLEALWFVVDSSGSISDAALAAAYSELLGALEEYEGGLEATLSFFEAAVTPPVPFCDRQELLRIKPQGGGGTSFYNIFIYMKTHLADRLPCCIIILTDGCAAFPPQDMALGIPVLWIINNRDEKIAPPWGKTARITV
jgi:predicted metal-dependent peptidase